MRWGGRAPSAGLRQSWLMLLFPCYSVDDIADEAVCPLQFLEGACMELQKLLLELGRWVNRGLRFKREDAFVDRRTASALV